MEGKRTKIKTLFAVAGKTIFHRDGNPVKYSESALRSFAENDPQKFEYDEESKSLFHIGELSGDIYSYFFKAVKPTESIDSHNEGEGVRPEVGDRVSINRKGDLWFDVCARPFIDEICIVERIKEDDIEVSLAKDRKQRYVFDHHNVDCGKRFLERFYRIDIERVELFNSVSFSWQEKSYNTKEDIVNAISEEHEVAYVKETNDGFHIWCRKRYDALNRFTINTEKIGRSHDLNPSFENVILVNHRGYLGMSAKKIFNKPLQVQKRGDES